MTRVKICGLSRFEDIDAVNCALPDFMGFVFAPSRCKVDIRTAAALKARLNPRIEAVGVFVNENIDVIAEIYRNGIIDIAQLHGDEDDAYIKRLKEICGCRIIKAIGVGATPPIMSVEADYLLFDTLSVQRGGSGRVFDWNILRAYRGPSFFLAGGLHTDNVVSALNILSPFCVDVSSGVETNGIKDAGKINEFILQVRGIGK
jgi:phosphoribosylanthranilate isomerase